MLNENEKRKDFQRAIKAYSKSDEARWVFAFFSSRIVGKYGFGSSRALANDMNVSSDTVENHAHAFWMFDKLRRLGSTERKYVNAARKLPYIYYSHFRALYDLQIQRGLTDAQIMNLLLDIVQAEGTISSRDLENHANERYGDVKNWDYYTQRVMKDISKVLDHPQLPKNIRKRTEEFYDFLGKNS